MDFESGIFLDLFPLDALPDDERAFRRQAWRAWLFNKLAIAKLTKNPYVAGGGPRAAVLRAGSTAVRALLNLPGLRAIRPQRPFACLADALQRPADPPRGLPVRHRPLLGRV